MTIELNRQRYLLLVALWQCFLFAMTAYLGLKLALYAHGWAIGDWLINYRDGFIRRGLSGELIWQIWQRKSLVCRQEVCLEVRKRVKIIEYATECHRNESQA